jgi:prenyltransferase beta subunit
LAPQAAQIITPTGPPTNPSTAPNAPPAKAFCDCALLKMVQKYAHLSSEHLAQWVDRRPVVMAEGLLGNDTIFAAGK